jgi:hypothetical protein
LRGTISSRSVFLRRMLISAALSAAQMARHLRRAQVWEETIVASVGRFVAAGLLYLVQVE